MRPWREAARHFGEETVDDLKENFLARSLEVYGSDDGLRIASALAWAEERFAGRLRASGGAFHRRGVAGWAA